MYVQLFVENMGYCMPLGCRRSIGMARLLALHGCCCTYITDA
jgi:hypothetical protein